MAPTVTSGTSAVLWWSIRSMQSQGRHGDVRSRLTARGWGHLGDLGNRPTKAFRYLESDSRTRPEPHGYRLPLTWAGGDMKWFATAEQGPLVVVAYRGDAKTL